MKNVVVRTGVNCITSHLAKAEICCYNENGLHWLIVATEKSNKDTYTGWSGGTHEHKALIETLNQGVIIVNNYGKYCKHEADLNFRREQNIIIDNDIVTGTYVDEYGEEFADSIRDQQKENPESDFSWFTGSGYYNKETGKDIFKNGGAVIFKRSSMTIN